MGNYLGIDQSYTCTGYYTSNGGCGVFKTTKELSIFERAMAVSDSILATCKEHNITHIGIEGLACGMRGDATRDLAGLQFVIVTNLMKNGFTNIDIISPKTVKKLATGSGKAKKNEMYDVLPQDVKDKIDQLGCKKTTGMYDITDAYWLCKITGDNNGNI